MSEAKVRAAPILRLIELFYCRVHFAVVNQKSQNQIAVSLAGFGVQAARLTDLRLITDLRDQKRKPEGLLLMRGIAATAILAAKDARSSERSKSSSISGRTSIRQQNTKVTGTAGVTLHFNSHGSGFRFTALLSVQNGWLEFERYWSTANASYASTITRTVEAG